MSNQQKAKTGAESVLLGIKRAGIDYLFANAGTDFPPIIKALLALTNEQLPCPVIAPHETAAVGMAHGYYLVTGKPQAVMVHVNVGLANAAMGVINAASDNIPMLVMSGRTPITQKGRAGARATPIQYGQEMYDQTSLVRDVVKYSYEMRYPEQGESLVTRAVAVACQAPMGPTYLSLPREPLDAEIPTETGDIDRSAPTIQAAADETQLTQLASWIAAAHQPLILVQRSAPDGVMAATLLTFTEQYGIAVVEPFSVRNVMPTQHPAFLGYSASTAIAEADLILAIDCDIPWVERTQRPNPDAKIIHLGTDPLFSRMPFREYPSDLNLSGEPASSLAKLSQILGGKLDASDPAIRQRSLRLATKTATTRSARETKARSGTTGTITSEWLSICVSDIMDDQAVAFTELGLLAPCMTLRGANRLFSNVHAGGLGWAMPAALGAQLADRDRLTIACIGDGSYIFANPVACHQIAEALDLPLLTIVKNNAMWNAVRRSVLRDLPAGTAAMANEIPFTSLEPVPDFTKTAAASRAHVERVERAEELPAALKRAVEVIRREKRQVLLDVITAASDEH